MPTNRSDSQALILARDVVKSIDNYDCRDADTERVVGTLAEYIVNGWWALSGGDLREFRCLVSEQRDRAIASICSMISMAHALRSGEGDAWVAETTGA